MRWEKYGQELNATQIKATYVVLNTSLVQILNHSYQSFSLNHLIENVSRFFMVCRFLWHPLWVSDRSDNTRWSVSWASVHSHYTNTCVHTYRWRCPPPDRSTLCTHCSCCSGLRQMRKESVRQVDWEESWEPSLERIQMLMRICWQWKPDQSHCHQALKPETLMGRWEGWPEQFLIFWAGSRLHAVWRRPTEPERSRHTGDDRLPLRWPHDAPPHWPER